MLFAFGNYVHYATFMSARALLSAGGSGGDEDQQTRAKTVIVSMLKKSAGQAGVDKFPSIAKGFGGGEVKGLEMDNPSQYSETERNLSWMQGVRYTFRGKLFILPLQGTGQRGPEMAPSVNSLQLTSESWLGREPTFSECQSFMGNKGSKVGGKGGRGWIFDNGC